MVDVASTNYINLSESESFFLIPRFLFPIFWRQEDIEASSVSVGGSRLYMLPSSVGLC
jgi:hypothetical protein